MHCILRNRAFRLFAVVFWIFFPVSFMAHAAETVVLDGTELDFTVIREGETIGTHTIKFARSDNQLEVDIKTDIKVSLAFITLYNFNHEGREVWQDGKLSKLVSQTDDDGTKHTLEVNGTTSALEINGDGIQSRADTTTIPASLWHPAFLQPGPTTILNTLDGHLMPVNIAIVGEESVDVRSESVLAMHIVVTGELERELWFDRQGLLVKSRFKGSDGSDIQYVLQ